MKSVLFILVLISCNTYSEEKCVDTEELYMFGLRQELIGEYREKITSSIRESEMMTSVIDQIAGKDRNETIAIFDKMQDLSLDAIVTAIEFQRQNKLEVTLFERRLSSLLSTIEEKSEYYPVTLGATAYHRLKQEIEGKI